MSEIKLKNCPFCGSEVELEDIGEDSNDHYYMIACKNSSCGSSTCFGEVSKDDFIRVWNTRKSIDDIVQQLEELETPCSLGHVTNGQYILRKDAIDIVKRSLR